MRAPSVDRVATLVVDGQRRASADEGGRWLTETGAGRRGRTPADEDGRWPTKTDAGQRGRAPPGEDERRPEFDPEGLFETTHSHSSPRNGCTGSEARLYWNETGRVVILPDRSQGQVAWEYYTR